MEKKQKITIIVTLKAIILTLVWYSFDTVSCTGQLTDTAQEPNITIQMDEIKDEIKEEPKQEEPKQEIIVPTAQDTATPPPSAEIAK